MPRNEIARHSVSEGSGSPTDDYAHQKSSFWSPCWRTLKDVCSAAHHVSPLQTALHFNQIHTLILIINRHAKRSGIFLKALYFISMITWSPDCHFGRTCLNFSIPTGCLSKIFPASFCSRPRSKSGFTRPLLDEFHDTRALACFLFISGLWLGPGLCLHQLSSLFSETHCLLVESNFNWNGWRYKSSSVHYNRTAEALSNH